jgi:hypothetical protein
MPHNLIYNKYSNQMSNCMSLFVGKNYAAKNIMLSIEKNNFSQIILILFFYFNPRHCNIYLIYTKSIYQIYTLIEALL